jgi:hypothetical protein
MNFPARLLASRSLWTGVLVAAIAVLALWSSAMLIGLRPIGKSPLAWLAYALVMSECIAIFGHRRELQGRRGIGWQGALIAAILSVTVLYVVTALGR